MKKVQAQNIGNGYTEVAQRVSVPTRHIRLPEVLSIVPMSASTLWRAVKRGAFPAPVKIGPRITAWSLQSVLAFLAEREAR